MGTWGASNFGAGNVTTLERAVRQLNPKAKQAMYGAARAQTIKKGTWDGCAFNKAGFEVGLKDGESVSSSHRAAEVFGLEVAVVDRFIKAWDGLEGTNEESTKLLIEVLEKVGLFSEPGTSRVTRKVRQVLYENVEKKLMEELEVALAKDEVEGICDAGELLFAGV